VFGVESCVNSGTVRAGRSCAVCFGASLDQSSFARFISWSGMKEAQSKVEGMMVNIEDPGEPEF